MGVPASITQQRRRLLDLLAAKPGGLLLGEVHKHLGGAQRTVEALLRRAGMVGLIGKTGAGTQTLWHLPENEGKAKARLAQLKAAAKARKAAANRKRLALDRFLKPKRRLRVRLVVTAPNSVWELAA